MTKKTRVNCVLLGDNNVGMTIGMTIGIKKKTRVKCVLLGDNNVGMTKKTRVKCVLLGDNNVGMTIGMTKKTRVKCVLLGDNKVGKSTIFNSCVVNKENEENDLSNCGTFDVRGRAMTLNFTIFLLLSLSLSLFLSLSRLSVIFKLSTIAIVLISPANPLSPVDNTEYTIELHDTAGDPDEIKLISSITFPRTS